MLKKSIAMLLTLSLCFSLASVAFAAETTKISAEAQTLVSRFDGDVKKDRALLRQVSYDLNLFADTMFDKDVEISSVDSSGKITYKIDYDDAGLTDYLTIEQDTNGNIVLDITENEKHNTIVLTMDDRLFIDGNEVTVEVEPETAVMAQQIPDPVQPQAGMYHRVFGVEPSFKNGVPQVPDGFSSTNGVYTGRNISLGEQIASFTISALIFAITKNTAKLLANSKVIRSLITLDHATSAIEGALNIRQNSLALIADQCGGATSLSVRVQEYAKNNNDSLYSEWYYIVTLYTDGGTHYSAAKKTVEAT